MIQSIKIKVNPRSAKNEVTPNTDGSLKVKIKASPVKGKANQELIKVLADHFQVAKSQIEIAKGLTGRNKIIKINGA